MAQITKEYSSLYRFDSSAQKAICIECKHENTFRGRTTGYTTLSEHYKSKHPEKYNAFIQKRNDKGGNQCLDLAKYFSVSKPSEMNQKTKLAILTCYSNHPIHTDFATCVSHASTST